MLFRISSSVNLILTRSNVFIVDYEQFFDLVMDRYQIFLLILSKFKRIN